MTSSRIAPERHVITAGETRVIPVSFDKQLEAGATFTGATPTITATGSSGTLTLANKTVSTAALTISGETVAIGRALLFTASAGTAGIDYTVTLTCGTDETPSQTIMGGCIVRVEANP